VLLPPKPLASGARRPEPVGNRVRVALLAPRQGTGDGCCSVGGGAAARAAGGGVRRRACRCSGSGGGRGRRSRSELAGRAQPAGVPQGLRVRDRDVGVPGRGRRVHQRPRPLHLGPVRAHPRYGSNRLSLIHSDSAVPGCPVSAQLR
jgi:hypothetical protein